MAILTSSYAVQEIFELKVFDLETAEALVVLNDLKETVWENNGETVYVSGGRGNAKIIGFGHSKSSMLNTQNAVMTDGTIAMQSGTDVETLTTTTVVTHTDIITVTSDVATTTYTATGTAGEEIGYAYVRNSDGSLGTKFTQDSATGSGKFTYTTGTKAVTFDAAALADGTQIVVFYKPTISTAKKFTNATDKFAKNVKVIADGLFRDICTGVDYKGQLIFYKAKVQEGYTFSLTNNGEPAVQQLNFEALKSCADATLWDLILYDEDDVS